MALIFSQKNFIKIIFNRKRHFASFSNLFKQLHFLLSFSKCLSRVEEPSTHTYSHTQLHTHTLQPYRASPRQHTDIHTHRQEGEGRGVCVCIAYCCRVGFANTFFFWWVLQHCFLILQHCTGFARSFLDILHCLPRAVGVPLESALKLVSPMSPCGAHDRVRSHIRTNRDIWTHMNASCLMDAQVMAHRL